MVSGLEVWMLKNGSSWISFNYTDSVVAFKATFITNSNVT